MITDLDDDTHVDGIELSQFDSPLAPAGSEADEKDEIIKSTEKEHLYIPKETFADRILRRKRAVPRIISIPHLQQQKKHHKKAPKKDGGAYFDEDEYLDSVELKQRFPKNIVRNQKYNVLTFLPLTLYDQFKYFYNLYFLGTALTQFFPILKVGYLFTYVVPLVFVLALSIGKEGYDDIKRMMQDKRANSQIYDRLEPSGKIEPIKSSEIKVGDLITVSMNNRVPADMVLLKTTDKSGASFIRTDQLDGETDWKLRRPLSHTQGLSQNELAAYRARIIAEAPSGNIYSFSGKFSSKESGGANALDEEPISVENMLWANTVVATGQIIGVVVYTGCETRSALNRTQPRSKSSQTELEINRLSKILFVVLSVLSIFMVAMQGFSGLWYVYFVRFMILFSSIIPISMRVNLDMAKLLYALMINKDKDIPGTVVRNSTLPEELGRINILLSDKTGTLTQNDMVFKKLHYGSGSYRTDDMDMLVTTVSEALAMEKKNAKNGNNTSGGNSAGTQVVKMQKTSPGKALQCIRAIALCHNVTPSVDTETGEFQYQASSPDEIALVKFTEKVGIQLYQRDLHNITLRTGADGSGKEEYEILRVFPFSSATKRMGIIVRDSNGNITFFMKGADVVMLKIISSEGSEWMEEETGNMAREGLRTLVFGYRSLSNEKYEEFERAYHEAECSMENRDANMQRVVESILEKDLQPLCVTGVEDKLQEDIRPTLELLQQAGIKVWMLTGDKVETATCIAISARLFKPTSIIKTIAGVMDPNECLDKINEFDATQNSVLVIDGNSLQVCLDNFCEEFFRAAIKAPSVVCCRCSPTQKALIVKYIKQYANLHTAAIGDGGNDVSMILEADVGLGIEGKEGKQASLAADFSLTQFSHISRLLLWHGRNSYKRSASLAQFIMHRGMIISVIQAIFSSLFFFAAVAIYQGWLLVGYATFYTMAPVFSLVLDQDVSSDVAMRFPELYKELQKGRVLSLKTFAWWMFVSVYQGGLIMVCALLLFEDNFTNIVSITFTALIITELLNIAFEIYTWNVLILLGEVVTALLYFISMVALPDYFSMSYIMTWNFWWKVLATTAVSCLPISLSAFIYRKCFPESWSVVTKHGGTATGLQSSLESSRSRKRFCQIKPW